MGLFWAVLVACASDQRITKVDGGEDTTVTAPLETPVTPAPDVPALPDAGGAPDLPPPDPGAAVPPGYEPGPVFTPPEHGHDWEHGQDALDHGHAGEHGLGALHGEAGQDHGRAADPGETEWGDGLDTGADKGGADTGDTATDPPADPAPGRSGLAPGHDKG